MNSEQTTRYVGTFKATTLRGVEHTLHYVIDAFNLEEATKEVERWMRCWICPNVSPPVLISVEEMS